jgi:hypothetical protein
MKLKMIAGALVGLAMISASGVQAQSWLLNAQSYALKSGESVEISDLYWVVNCRSQLTSTPEVTVMDGPPGVTASVTEAMVLPRYQQCAKQVKGGKLRLTVDKVEDESHTVMTANAKRA